MERKCHRPEELRFLSPEVIIFTPLFHLTAPLGQIFAARFARFETKGNKKRCHYHRSRDPLCLRLSDSFPSINV